MTFKIVILMKNGDEKFIKYSSLLDFCDSLLSKPQRELDDIESIDIY